MVERDQRISKVTSILLHRLSDELGSDVLAEHANDLWRFLKKLASGSDGKAAQDLAIAVLNNERQRVQLFEDSLLPFGTGKIEQAAELAASRRPAVIYCRQINLVERLRRHTWPSVPAVAHSALGDRYLREIQQFKDGFRNILIMTRDLGKRGIDFPMAKSLVLFSPKSSAVVMDQELCRTRGQRRTRPTKVVHLLYYRGTYEEEKLRRVMTELLGWTMYARFRKFDLTRTWLTWLRQRRGLSLAQYVRA